MSRRQRVVVAVENPRAKKKRAAPKRKRAAPKRAKARAKKRTAAPKRRRARPIPKITAKRKRTSRRAGGKGVEFCNEKRTKCGPHATKERPVLVVKRGRRRRANGPAARALYSELHWGDDGSGRMVTLDVPSPRPSGVYSVLGRFEVAEYATRKGVGRDVEVFVHRFRHPVYLVVDSKGDLHVATVPGKRRYIVTERGIEG